MSVIGATNRCVFLDRDGVLNKAVVRNGKPYPPNSPEELELSSDAVAGCERLKRAGFRLVVVTNQPDVGRGKQAMDLAELSLETVRMFYKDAAAAGFKL